MVTRQFARMAIRNRHNHFLLLHNIKEGRNRWEFPGGKVDRGESPSDAAFRETVEETGLEVGFVPVPFYRCSILIDGGWWEGNFFQALYNGDLPQIQEPDKFDNIGWVSFDKIDTLPQIPRLTWEPAQLLVKSGL